MNKLATSSSALLDQEIIPENDASDLQEEQQKNMFDSLVQQALGKYRQALSITQSITERDLQEYEQNSYSDSQWIAVGADTYEKRAQLVRDDLEKWLPELIMKTMTVEQNFQNDLEEAVKNNWISEKSAGDWMNRLKSTDMKHFEKLAFIEEKFSSMKEAWKKVAKDRANTEALAKQLSVTIKDVPEMADLDVKKFLSFHYLVRVNKVSKINALILAKSKDKMRYIKSMERMLEGVAKVGYMHSSKVGPWMQRIMESENPEEFVKNTLKKCIKNWQDIKIGKDGFDKLNEAIEKKGIPRGFQPCSEEEFLLKNYKQRTSYCALAWLRLENVEEEHKELAGLKLRIRHCLDTQDWEGASQDLPKAIAIRSEDRELISMQKFLDCHCNQKAEDTQEAEKESTPVELNQELQNLIAQLGAISPTVQAMYVDCMRKGLGSFIRLLQVVYNRKWWRDVARISEQQENEMLERSRSDERFKNTMSILDVQNDGPENVLAAVSNHADENAGKASPNFNEHEKWGYYATIYLPIPFALQNQIITNLHYPLKSKLRRLNEMGYDFSLLGEPQSRNGSPAAKKPQKPVETYSASKAA